MVQNAKSIPAPFLIRNIFKKKVIYIQSKESWVSKTIGNKDLRAWVLAAWPEKYQETQKRLKKNGLDQLIINVKWLERLQEDVNGVAEAMATHHRQLYRIYERVHRLHAAECAQNSTIIIIAEVFIAKSKCMININYNTEP